MLVFFLMCHRRPGHVAYLFRHIHRPGHRYILHADRKSAPALRGTVAALAAAYPNVTALPSGLCGWGGWSLVEATLRGIAAALALPGGWSHFVPLSEAHVPLHAPDEIAATLEPGVSYSDARPIGGYDANGRADVLHRFATIYRELPGVGMFATAPRTPPPEFLAALHHGSQWLVLSREACEWLHAAPDAGWQPYRTSLLADETAIQTVLSAGPSPIRRQPTTFVAWPHLSGTDDWTFSEANFLQARADGYAFIRKRPATLPAGVAAALAPLATPLPLPALPEPSEAFSGGAAAASLAAALTASLAGRHPGLAVTPLLPMHTGGSASCYLRLRSAALPEPLFAALVSEDFRHFKAVLAWTGQPEEFRIRTLGGAPTALLKVRLWDLLLAREVLPPDLPDSGFLTLGPEEGPGRLADLVGRLLTAGERLAPAVG